MNHKLASRLALACAFFFLATMASCTTNDGDGESSDSDAATTVDGTDDVGGVDTGMFDTGTGDATTADTGTTTAPVIRWECPFEQEIVEGLNSGWNVDGTLRDFHVDFPNVSDDTPVAVIFSWHGVGDTIDNFRAYMNFNPDGDPDFPFVVVTPHDTGLLPISSRPGMTWDILYSTNGDDNLEASLFKGVMGCLNQQITIDTERIYSVGFSGGAIAADMLHARFPDLVGAVVAMSGAWFNNHDTVETVNTMGVPVTVGWDDFAEGTEGTVLITHGGTNDSYAITQEIINFDVAAGLDVPFLVENHRTVIDCVHNGGHAPHPNIRTAQIVAFFKAHRLNQTSPYWTEGLPSDFPGSCSLN